MVLVTTRRQANQQSAADKQVDRDSESQLLSDGSQQQKSQLQMVALIAGLPEAITHDKVQAREPVWGKVQRS